MCQTFKHSNSHWDLQKFAVWLFLPRHVEDVIQIILFFTGAYTAYDISVQVLHILGIDQLFEDAVKRMGADMVSDAGDEFPLK